jgi:hypothetical protein
VADSEPRYRAPVAGRDGLGGEAGMMRCMGVHMACMTSGGSPSKRIMLTRNDRLY